MSSDIITIDGPTSSGKSSVGFLLARKLGYQYIDTGTIYRAGCYCILQNHIPLENKEEVLGCYRDLKLDFKIENGENKVYLRGEDVTSKLHTPEISKIVPIVAARLEVRAVLRQLQRRLGSEKNTVMLGRDIGSEIFPNAEHKFYLTASLEIRAKRRFAQLRAINPAIKYEDVLKDMMERDEMDMTRDVSPLVVPQGAVVIDNSDLGVEETVEEMLENINSATK